MQQKQNHRFDAVIFDIDNVLVDTRFSYTDCIRETVQKYLEQFLNFKPSKISLFSQKDIEIFKLFGGFNDDWDACYGLLLYLLSLKRKENSIAELKKLVHLKSFAQKVKPPLFVRGIERLCGRYPKVSLKKIEKLFQKLYWSKYIRRETPALPSGTFQQLARGGIKIGIATGRNREEACYVLKRFGLLKWIGEMVTVDRLPHPRFKKPHPFALLEIGKKFGLKLRYLYVGDLPDDIQTAKRAKTMNVTPWGFTYFSAFPQKAARALKQAGAKRIIKNPRELKRLLAQIA
ncbi:MAG: HAD family hydrolase [Candidatus Omnitrophica bacterium]|nr:HAD family hydrolase [Candidatus Omnitrophota bacterium]